MKNLLIDMTPTFINSTGIYYVALDTVNELQKKYSLSYKYINKLYDNILPPSQKDQIIKNFMHKLGQLNESLSYGHELQEAEESSTYNTILFDPLYILFPPNYYNKYIFVLDTTPLTNPEWHNPVVAKLYERAFYQIVASKAHLISISQHTTNSMKSIFGITDKDISTIPLYLRKINNSYSPDKKEYRFTKYFLFVGSLELRKNIIGMIEAYNITNLYAKGVELVIAGGNGHGHESIKNLAKQSAGVHLLGYVSSIQLEWLYKNALAFIYPSFLEGFGLPLLEAMSYGLPCIASITGASPEILGQMGILVNPYDIKDIADKIKECWQRCQDKDIPSPEQLKEQISSFSFNNYTQKLFKILKE